ncbi:MAG: sugar kinase [Candidatus Diapherotrites archaeon]|nr:sugar kinase [Candidatus Diapherotrites archaeon]
MKKVEVVVVGSVAFDSVKTPFGEVERVLGGSASFFSIASSFFAKTGLVGVVGRDFDEKFVQLFRKKGVDVSGLEYSDGKTFFWKGFYDFDLNIAHTIETQLNVFSSFKPVLPSAYRDAPFLFLGNISPALQLEVLEQMKKRPLTVACDTMNYYIEREPHNVKKVISHSDICLMNEAEARELFKTTNLVVAAKQILLLGAKHAIIKKGEHGSLLFSGKSFFFVPGYPLEKVVDPTGSGDSFAGGLLGFLASQKKTGGKSIRRAMVYASAIASMNAEQFSTRALESASLAQIRKRVKEFRKMTEF